MRTNISTVAVVIAIVGAAGFALANASSVTSVPAPSTPRASESTPHEALTHPFDTDDTTAELPPNHPPIDGVAAPGAGAPSPHGHGLPAQGSAAAPAADEASLTWKVDASWPTRPNPSSMRLETRAVPHVAGDTEDAELAVTRAGGDVDANVSRWATQFEGGPKPERHELVVRGLAVTTVTLEGTFSGGMGQAAGSHPGWAMLGAIVVAPGQPYFFKLTGPRATVLGARAKFDVLVQSVAKK